MGKSHLAFVAFLILMRCGASLAQAVAPLPDGVRAVWELDKAYREATPTRERVCLNGLWRWQPADAADAGPAAAPPADGWGHFKVPGAWPGITDYLQKDSQTVHAHPAWRGRRMADVAAAWHQRAFTVPADWAGRRVTLAAAYVNSLAVVFLDGKRVGEIRFPDGEVDLTAACTPGRTHVLSLLVVAMPLDAVLVSHRDTAAATTVKGRVARRGLCGDVWLVGTPAGPRVEDARVATSVRRGEVELSVAAAGWQADATYRLRASVAPSGGEGATRATVFTSDPFKGREAVDGRFSFTAKWKPDRLWDLHVPSNTYQAEVELLADGGAVVDRAWPVRFGFRELWIDGRDFYLNGTRLYLSAVPLDNAQIGAAWATYAAARETFARLRSFGINFVYTHNYDCQPGAHLDFEQILRAADDAGVLVALSQPHFSHYDWTAADADRNNGYAAHAAFYARVAANHPSVVFYATSHNATGYAEDMNPDLIGRGEAPRDNWATNNARRALRAEAIVRRADPSRIVYHHASGNLGAMHPMNFYLNFVPVQEMSDWFETWSQKGDKPAFMCEYGVPFSWDWTMYRGWYRGKREFGSARVPWEYCSAEWNAQFLGDRAYAIGDAERANLRWEAKQFRAGNVWNRWDYPAQVGSSRLDDQYEVLATYIADNFRAFRTHGVSATSPWEYGRFWKERDGLKAKREDLPTDWDGLQRPGLSADYIEQRPARMDVAYEPDDWVATPAAKALMRNNRPLLAYIAGKPAAFTSKDHNFAPGQTVEKQLVIINNCRQTVVADCEWSLALPKPIGGTKQVTVGSGDQSRVPLRFDLPATLAPGTYPITARVRFGGDGGGGEIQTDSFAVHVLATPPALPRLAELALFDPGGETAAWLDKAGATYRKIGATADLAGVKTLIVGKRALTVDGPAPDLRRVRDGLNVIVFEQTADVLEKRLGFRVVEYGLRNVWSRIPDHPLLAGLAADHLRDWTGDATLLPPRLAYTLRPQHGPTVQWCGMPVSRAWRCGNRGNVASVLVEKPPRGDFRPIFDGGYALQYSPLMEYREGAGRVLFCQLDVTGRSENDPAAQTLAANLLRYAAAPKPSPARSRSPVYAGEEAGLAHLRAAGFAAAPFDPGQALDPAAHVLVVGPGGSDVLRGHAWAVADFVKRAGPVTAVGLDEAELAAFLPMTIRTTRREHIAATFAPPANASPLAGVSPADVHNRDPRELPLIAGGASPLGDGILAAVDGAHVVLCQLVPWRFAEPQTNNLRRTHRRASFLLTRLLANAGAATTTPLLDRLATGAGGPAPYLDGLYLDRPEEWDDPYRFFRW